MLYMTRVNIEQEKRKKSITELGQSELAKIHVKFMCIIIIIYYYILKFI